MTNKHSKHTAANTSVKERRLLSDGELRIESDGNKQKIVGYAAKFSPAKSSDMGGWFEQIDSHAFDTCLATKPDVRCLFNHDSNQPPLGRSSSGTLRLRVDQVGLFYECDAADNQMTRDILISMKRGDISQSSFGFQCSLDKWEQADNGDIIRTVLEAQLFDVSPVNFGAYPDATSGVRTSLRSAPASIRAILKGGKSVLGLDDPDDLSTPDDPDTPDDQDVEDDLNDCDECRAAHVNHSDTEAQSARAAHRHLLSLRRL